MMKRGKAKRRKEPVFKFQKVGIASDCAPSFQKNGRRKEAPMKSSFFVKDFEKQNKKHTTKQGKSIAARLNVDETDPRLLLTQQ